MNSIAEQTYYGGIGARALEGLAGTRRDLEGLGRTRRDSEGLGGTRTLLSNLEMNMMEKRVLERICSVIETSYKAGSGPVRSKYGEPDALQASEVSFTLKIETTIQKIHKDSFFEFQCVRFTIQSDP